MVVGLWSEFISSGYDYVPSPLTHRHTDIWLLTGISAELTFRLKTLHKPINIPRILIIAYDHSVKIIKIIINLRKDSPQ